MVSQMRHFTFKNKSFCLPCQADNLEAILLLLILNGHGSIASLLTPISSEKLLADGPQEAHVLRAPDGQPVQGVVVHHLRHRLERLAELAEDVARLPERLLGWRSFRVCGVIPLGLIGG